MTFRRVLLRLVLVVLVALPAAPAVASSRQELAGSDSTPSALEARRKALVEDITAVDRELADLTRAAEAAQAEVRTAKRRIAEADEDVALLRQQRKEPANLLRRLMIEAYINGDPRMKTLVSEMVQLESSIDGAAQRQLYTAVARYAVDTVDAIDASIREIRDQKKALAKALPDLEAAFRKAHEKQAAVATRRRALGRELASIDRQLEALASKAGRFALTGVPGSNPTRPALAVKVDNHPSARPQAGLTRADVVYEELVEGGLSRFVAVYHGRDAGLVGPVRSARSSDFHVLANLNTPLFANSGGNPGVLAEMRTAPVADVSHRVVPGAYHREAGRRRPHNLFTSTASLYAVGPDVAGIPTPLFHYRSGGVALPASASPVGGVTITFGSTTAQYSWDAGAAGWARTQNGTAHTDASGGRITPTNVIVQFVEYGRSKADAASPEVDVSGSGTAWVLTDGKVVHGRWERPRDGDIGRFVDGDGNDIPLQPGPTWVALAPIGSGTLR